MPAAKPPVRSGDGGTKRLKKLLALSLALALALLTGITARTGTAVASAQAAQQQAQDKDKDEDKKDETVKIIAFNDFHGNLESPGSFSNLPAGGVDVLAAYVSKLQEQNPNNVVVSSGDLIGASPLISAFFHDEGTIETMNRLGLEFNAVGNHEFDEGRDELLRMQNGGCHPTDPNSCKGISVGTPVPFEGAKFQFLAANVVDTTTGQTIFPASGFKKFGGKVRVGFIGLTLKETPTIVTPSGVAGLDFIDEADAINEQVGELRKKNVEAIVVLVHQGGFQGPTSPNFINDCSLLPASSNPLTPIRDIVSRFDDAVDLVISGHTHTGYNCVLPNKNGRNIPVTQASSFGRVLSDIDLTIDGKSGDVTGVSVNNVIVDRSAAGITPNAAIKGIVDGYNALVSPLANAVIGRITGPVSTAANAAGEMDAGDLIADAQLEATKPAQFGGAVAALMNPGGVRGSGFVTGPFPHDVTYREAFTLQPFGNSLVTMTLTVQQIRDVLEQQFVGCNGQTVQRILQVSKGFVFTWSAGAAPCSKIQTVMLNNLPLVAGGAVLNTTASFRVTVNNFLSTGGDNFTVLKSGTNVLGGAQDIDALIAYMAVFKAPSPPYDPTAVVTLGKPRITRVP